MKKLMALFLTLIIAFSCTACGGGSANSGEGAIKSCIEALKKLEVGEALSYVEGAENIVKNLPFDNLDSAISYAEDFLPIIEEAADIEIPKSLINVARKQSKSYLAIIADCIEYEIKEEDKDGDEATYTVEFTVPDFENLEGAIDEGEVMKIATKYADELSDMQDIEDIADIDTKVIDSMLSDFQGLIKDALKEADTIEEELEVIVVKDGGKWYISQDNEFFEGIDFDEIEDGLEEFNEQYGDIKDIDPEEFAELMEMMM